MLAVDHDLVMAQILHHPAHAHAALEVQLVFPRLEEHHLSREAVAHGLHLERAVTAPAHVLHLHLPGLHHHRRTLLCHRHIHRGRAEGLYPTRPDLELGLRRPGTLGRGPIGTARRCEAHDDDRRQ